MNRKTIAVIAVGTALGAASLSTPAVASAAPFTCAKTSAPGAENGWGNTFNDEKGQAGTYSDTKVIDDDGSLQFKTTAENPRNASYHAANLPLADITKQPLTFEKTAGNANWQIRVTGANIAGSNDGFATIVLSAPDEKGEVADARDSDEWWVTRNLPGISRGTRTTLAEIIKAANSDGKTTKIDHYGISSQPSGKTGTVNIDNVSFNGCTTNFLAKPAPGSSGSLGGLSLSNLFR